MPTKKTKAGKEVPPVKSSPKGKPAQSTEFNRAKKKGSKQSPQKPKGMRDLFDKDYYRLLGFMEKAAEVAIYYGFKPLATPIIEHEEVFSSTVGQSSDIVDKEIYHLKGARGGKLVLRPEATAGVMRAYLENGMQTLPQPVMLYTCGSFFRHNKPQRGRYREFNQFNFEVIGTNKSITDALVIKLTSLILEEAGLKNLLIEINSIGDKECRSNFRRELTAYYRKHLNKLCGDCNVRIKENPLRLLDCKEEKCQEFKEKAPDPISFLCDDCKKHFKEVLECLEAMEVPYMINKNLVRGLDYYTRTVFEISEQTEDGGSLSIAGGGRYDYLAKALGGSRDIPAVGAAIGVERVLMSENSKDLSPRIVKKQKVFFIQLGVEAKIKSLDVIEILRKARIPVRQSISKDSLSVQLGTAEKLKIPYVIIMGQKEVSDGTVIVRKMEDRSQKIVKIEELSDYLKTLK